MNRGSVVVVVVGLGCIAAYGAVAGAPAGPSTGEGSYEVTVPTDELFVHPTVPADAAAGGALEIAGVELSGQLGWIGPIGIVVVFGLWLLIAFRIMGAPAVVFTLLAMAPVLGVWYLVGLGGGPAEVASPDRELSILDLLAGLLIALVFISTGVALLLPDDADAYTADISLLQGLMAAVSDVVDRFRHRSTSPESSPTENDLYRVWWQFARRYRPNDERDTGMALTPGELAQRARRAGAPAGPVAELRREFERVRYGDASPTDERVERATGAWQRVEDERSDR